MAIVNAQWVKNTLNGDWFDLLRLNLSAPYFSGKKGVFVVWYISLAQAKVIKVGSGNLAEQLRSLQVNPIIMQYANSGPIKVSWVVANGILPESQLLGAEAYLFRKYTPLVGEKKPDPEIEINLIPI